MHLIVILICLGLDRYWQSRVHLRKYDWYYTLLFFLQDRLFAKKTFIPVLTLAICLLLVLIPLILLQLLLRHAYHGIPLFLFHVFVLYYCFGETNFKEKLANYLTANTNHDPKAAHDALANQELLQVDTHKKENLTDQICAQLLTLANQNMIAVIFWYLVLGLPGALLYRFATQLLHLTTLSNHDNKGDSFPQIRAECQQLVQCLVWLPARILGLCYALAGNFVQSFKYWVTHLFGNLEQTDEFLKETGFAAIGLPFTKKNSLHTEEVETAVIDLIDRALIIILVVVALLTLGAWLG